MQWSKVFGKFAIGTLCAVGAIIVQALITGLSQFKPADGTETMIWTLFGASIVGGLQALLNWIKHRNDGKN